MHSATASTKKERRADASGGIKVLFSFSFFFTAPYVKDTANDVAERVLKEEHKVFAHVVAALVDGRIEFREDGVPVIVGEDGVRE